MPLYKIGFIQSNVCVSAFSVNKTINNKLSFIKFSVLLSIR